MDLLSRQRCLTCTKFRFLSRNFRPIFRFGSGLTFTTKVPYQFLLAHVHDAPNHFVSFTIELYAIKEIYRCTNFHAACSKFPEIRGLLVCTCVARAPCTIISQALHHRIALVEKYQCIKFRFLAKRFPKVEVHMQMHSALHVHCALCHETTCNIELRSSNSISVPNLVSIAQNFPEPEDPSRINFSSPGARSLHPTGTIATKTYGLG